MWETEQEKLEKAGRKWSEADDPRMGYRFAHFYCEKCGKDLGQFDIVTTNPETFMYCHDCVKEYIKPVPNNLGCGTVIEDHGINVVLKYTGGYYKEIVVEKICYFNKKGRYIKVKGKRYYI